MRRTTSRPASLLLALAATVGSLSFGVSSAASAQTVRTTSRAKAARPPKPACDAGPGYGCFAPAPPEPGTKIPKVGLHFSLRPSADNSFYIVALKKHWFEDVGLSILPSPYGFKATNENAIPLALNDQNNVGAMYGGSVIDTLKTDKTLKMIMFTDDYVGNMLWADPSLHLKGISSYLAKGLSFKAALRKTLEPTLKPGVQVATTPLLDTRPLINALYGLAGLPKPKLLLVSDTESLILAKSGKIHFAIPTSAATDLTYSLDGWKALVGQKDLVDNVKGDNPLVEPLVQTVGVMANKNWIEKNQNATLRFVSVVFRTISAIKADRGRSGGLMSIAVPFINSYAGTNLTPKELFQVYSELDPLSSWQSQTKYFVNKQDPRYYKTAYGAYIKSDVAQKVLPVGMVPDDGIWAAQIYATLRWYQVRATKLISGLSGSAHGRAVGLLAQAKKYYSWYDFLDAYRLAEAAKAAA